MKTLAYIVCFAVAILLDVLCWELAWHTSNSLNMRNPVSPEWAAGLTASKLSELLRIPWNELVLSAFALVKAQLRDSFRFVDACTRGETR